MKKKWYYLIYALPIAVIGYLIYNSATVTFEKRIVGKWKLIDVQIENKEINQSNKLTPELQKKLDETKKMFLQEPNILTLQFGEDKKMTIISSKGKTRPYKIIDNEQIDVEDAAGEIAIKKAFSFTFKNKLQIAAIPLENGHSVMMIFEQQQ